MLTLPLLFVVISRQLHHIPKSIDDLLLLTEELSDYTAKTYDITIENGSDWREKIEEIQSFCKLHDVDDRKSFVVIYTK